MTRTYIGPMVMLGEGAYAGLTAIVGFESFGEDCAVRGYIIDGSVPPPPVPNALGPDRIRRIVDRRPALGLTFDQPPGSEVRT